MKKLIFLFLFIHCLCLAPPQLWASIDPNTSSLSFRPAQNAVGVQAMPAVSRQAAKQEIDNNPLAMWKAHEGTAILLMISFLYLSLFAIMCYHWRSNRRHLQE